LDVDLSYVVDYLRQETGARTVIATASKFGWENLWVQCICLYADADTTQSLAESAAIQSGLTIILEGKLRYATTNEEDATTNEGDATTDEEDEITNEEAVARLLEPPDLSLLAISKRTFEIRRNYAKARRMVPKIGPFIHGQSISLLGAETKGSVAVFLSPEDETENRVYALTAYHVVPFKSANETRVITPGGLDILSRLLEIHSSPIHHEELDFLLKRFKNACGKAQYGHIGVTKNGWRSDWALVCLENEWKGVNGSWMDNKEMRQKYMLTSSAPDMAFTGSSGIIACVDATAGSICYNDGASTGCTAGRIGETEALMFKKGTAEPITEEEIQEQNTPRSEVDRTTFVTVHPIGNKRDDVVLPGDSGCGAFCPVPEKDGWSWVGQLVGIFYFEDGGSIGLMVPQSEVFHSLQEITGKSWLLSVKNT
jgi:hypothetical protein